MSPLIASKTGCFAAGYIPKNDDIYRIVQRRSTEALRPLENRLSPEVSSRLTDRDHDVALFERVLCLVEDDGLVRWAPFIATKGDVLLSSDPMASRETVHNGRSGSGQGRDYSQV